MNENTNDPQEDAAFDKAMRQHGLGDPRTDVRGWLSALDNYSTIMPECVETAGDVAEVNSIDFLKHAGHCPYCFLSACRNPRSTISSGLEGAREFADWFDGVLDEKKATVLEVLEPRIKEPLANATSLHHLVRNIGPLGPKNIRKYPRLFFLSFDDPPGSQIVLRKEFDKQYKGTIKKLFDRKCAETGTEGEILLESIQIRDLGSDTEESREASPAHKIGDFLSQHPSWLAGSALMVILADDEITLVQSRNFEPAQIARAFVAAIVRYQYDPRFEDAEGDRRFEDEHDLRVMSLPLKDVFGESSP